MNPTKINIKTCTLIDYDNHFIIFIVFVKGSFALQYLIQFLLLLKSDPRSYFWFSVLPIRFVELYCLADILLNSPRLFGLILDSF
jgi:hypothetical protein